MSTRTIVEINHDRLQDLLDAGHISYGFMRLIADGADHASRYTDVPQGVRLLGSRHHSETLKLVVK